MPQETLGYIQLEWTCPKCSSRNPGTLKTCASCGAPQPENVQFEQVEGQVLSQDEALKKAAEAGADIHCPYCGARNPAGTLECSQCGGDLSEGARREAGRVVGAFGPKQVRQIACPRCKTMNPETNLKCANCGAQLTRPDAVPAPAPAARPAARPGWIIWAVGGLVLFCIVVFAGWFLSRVFSSEDTTGVVEAVEWRTVVEVEQLGPVTRQDWEDSIPNGASLGSCRDEVRSVTDSEPAGGDYNKVCGTPYTVDTGSGVGKVVQDCQYEVLEPYCEYTVQEWQVVQQAAEQGNDFAPMFASPQLSGNQRLGDQQTSYVVVFETSQGQYEYTTTSLQEYLQFQIGSEWTLSINGLNMITGVEPAQ